MKLDKRFSTCFSKFRLAMTGDVVFVSNDAFVTYIVNMFNTTLLKIYILLQRFPYYSHSPDCRYNIGIISSISLWHLMKKVIASIYRHLRLLTINLTSLADTSTPALKQIIA